MLGKIEKKINYKKEGFTLIEVLIYTVLLGLILSSLVGLIFLISGLKNKNYALREVDASANLSLRILTNKIREAKSVIIPTAGTSADYLRLQMPDNSFINVNVVNGILILNDNGVEYSLNSKKTNISNLIFRNFSITSKPANIGINFTISFLSNLSRNFQYERNFHTAVSLRQ